jgi:hypothetical protein
MQADLAKLALEVPKLEKTLEEQAQRDEAASAGAEKVPNPQAT